RCRQGSSKFFELGKNAQLFVCEGHFPDGDDEGRGPHALFWNAALMNFPNLPVRLNHGFLEAGIDEVDFVRAADQELPVLLRHLLSDHLLDRAYQLLVFYLLEMLLQAAESHMGQILSPFEVRDRHTPGI